MGTSLRSPRHHFVQTISVPDQHVDLALAALYVAAEEYPRLDIPASLGRLALLARRVRSKLRRYHSQFDVLHALNEVLFDEEGLRGNRRHYYDPRNSFLSDVLLRKVGTPISLSLVYLEVARRVGYRFYGVGLPGHFVVRAGDGDAQIFVDPFDRGGLLTRRECTDLVRRAAGANARIEPFLRPMSNRGLLRRMLTNLKVIYLSKNDLPRALRAAERIQLVEPEAWQNLGDLARIHTELGDFTAAAQTLTQYLERAPRGEDLRYARATLKALRGQRAGPDGSVD